MREKTQRRPRNDKPVIKSDGSHVFDYKDITTVEHFLTEQGKMIPRSRSGLTSKEQHKLTKAVKRARLLALLPFAS